MTEPEIEPIPLPPADAYALLSKETLDLSDEDIRRICNDLRARRQKFLQGVADRPNRKPKQQVDTSPEAKAARTESISNDLLSLKF